jgi:chaperonin cofactor prefoldin
MYVTDKELKFQLREHQSSLHELATDLGGDIRYLHSEISELQDTVKLLQEELQSLKGMINGS